MDSDCLSRCQGFAPEPDQPSPSLAIRPSMMRSLLASTLAIPSGVNNLSVVVVSKDGSFDLEKQISANLSSSFSPTLFVAINGNTMDLQWKAARNPTN